MNKRRKPLTRPDPKPETRRRNFFGDQGKKALTRLDERKKENTTRFRGTELKHCTRHFLWCANAVRSKKISPPQGQAITASLRALVQCVELQEYSQRLAEMHLLLKGIRGETFKLPPPPEELNYLDGEWDDSDG